MLLSAFGRSSFDTLKNNHVYILKKSSNLLRDIKGLDKKTSRELFKAAVLYVKTGQDDEYDILNNPQGSAEYEQFLLSMGWEVRLPISS